MTVRFHWRLARALLTILFGSVPATVISLLPLSALVLGFLGLVSSNTIEEFFSFFLLFAWGLVALFGTVSLWAVALLERSSWMVAGLIGGLIAIMPVSIIVGHQLVLTDILPARFSWEWVAEVGFVTVPVVAIAWLLILGLFDSRF